MTNICDSTRRLLLHILFLLFSAGLASNLGAAPAPYAETVIINGEVITADSRDPEAVSIEEAVAIRGDSILAVGSNAEIRELIADWTEVIDAKGNTVIPGLIDTHNHIYENTLGFSWVVRRMPAMLEIEIEADNVEDLSRYTHQAVQARVRQVPEGQWIRIAVDPAQVAVQAFGKTITRASLDQVAPNNPAFVSTRGGSVLNTGAIRSFEDYYGTRLPESYWMEDRELGWSGEYNDFDRCAKIDIINTNQGTFDDYILSYFEVMQTNGQLGVTTYKTHLQCEGGFSATTHLDRHDLMPMRLAWGHRWWQPFTDRIRETYRRIGDFHGYGSEYMWSIGSSVGGIDAGGVGWCSTLPADENILRREQCPPLPEGVNIPEITETRIVPNRGRRVEHLDTLAALAGEGRITGIPGWHVAGDGALEVLFETYRKHMTDDRIRALRIQSDHCFGVRQDQIEAAARLGHTFACNYDTDNTQVIKEDYGEEYLTMNLPVASMLEAGVNTVISSFSNYGVLRDSAFEDGINWLTRTDENGEPWGVPEEAVPDKMTLLLMMTRYGAHPLWKEDEIGSIEPGKKADIVILNGDYLDTPTQQLDELTPILTMIGGQATFESPELRGNSLRFNADSTDWTVDMNTPTDIWRWETPPVVPPFLTGAGGMGGDPRQAGR